MTGEDNLDLNEEFDMDRPLLSEDAGKPRGCIGHVKNIFAPVEDEKLARTKRKLLLALALSFSFMLLELVGGALAHSLAIMTDAAHMLSDATSFFISLTAVMIATKKPNTTFTFGYQRAEVIGSLMSVLIIWILTFYLMQEAIHRVHDITYKEDIVMIDGKLMTIIAVIALVVNSTLMYVLGHGHDHGHGHGHDHGHDHGHGHGHHNHSGHGHHNHSGHGHHNHSGHGHHNHSGHRHHNHNHDDHDHHEHDLENNASEKVEFENMNIRAAYIHALGDLIQSIGVCIAGVIIWVKPSWQIADPICTFLFGILVIYTTIQVLNQSIRVLMECAPTHIDLDSIKSEILAIPNVREIHDLHIWSITTGTVLCTAHLALDCLTLEESCDIIRKATEICKEGSIYHVTLQVETYNVECPTDICL